MRTTPPARPQRPTVTGRVFFPAHSQLEPRPDVGFVASLRDRRTTYHATYDVDPEGCALFVAREAAGETRSLTPEGLLGWDPRTLRHVGALLLALADAADRELPALEAEARRVEAVITAHMEECLPPAKQTHC